MKKMMTRTAGVEIRIEDAKSNRYEESDSVDFESNFKLNIYFLLYYLVSNLRILIMI